MSNARNNAAKLRQVFNPLEPRFGAKGDNSTNDTSALQSALNAAIDEGGTFFLPGGASGRNYRQSGLTIDGPVTMLGEGCLSSVLTMIGGSNANAITVAVGVGQGLVLQNFGINGVRSANTSGHGIHFPVDAVNTYGQAAIMRDLFITECAGDSIRVDGNRNNGSMSGVYLARSDNGMRIDTASDWRVQGGGMYIPDENCLLVVAGADNVFNGTAFYGATAASAVKLDGDSSSPTKLIACTINDNDRDGLEIVGPSGVARHIAHVIMGCWFERNGTATNDTYSDIVLTDVSGVILSANTFRRGSGSNFPRYTVEFSGTTAVCEWVGNSIAASPTPYVTALTNEPLKLGATVVQLYLPNAQEFANDAAAGVGGVPVGGVYFNGSDLKRRKT